MSTNYFPLDASDPGPAVKKVKATTKAEVTGTTATEWKIVGWNGPISDTIRSQASCVVTVGEDPDTQLRLRFYIRPYYNYEVNNAQYCQATKFYKFNNCNNSSQNASSYLQTESIKSNGYSLFVDVLSDQKSMCFLVSVNNDQYFPPATMNMSLTANNLFTRTNMCMSKEFWRTTIYTLDLYTNKHRNVRTYNPGPADLIFNINVTVYDINSKGEEIQIKNEESKGRCSDIFQDLKTIYTSTKDYSDLVLFSKDDGWINTHKLILAARSPYFRRLIAEECSSKEDSSGIITLDNVNAKALDAILYWMYTDELQNEIETVLEEVIQAAELFELKGFKNMLDTKLSTLCSTENMFRLVEVARSHAMPTALKESIH